MSMVAKRSWQWSRRLVWARRAWTAVLWPTLWRLNSHRTSLVAAGCAFYATLALFPAMSMLVSLYGLAFDPYAVESQLTLLRGLLPTEAYRLIAQALPALVTHQPGTLGLSLFIGAAITLWSAAMGTKSMLAALNLAYDEAERRGILRFQFTGLVLTLAAILGGALALAVLVALPAAALFVGFPYSPTGPIHLASLGIMILYVSALLAGLYRFGPSRPPGQIHRVLLPGTIVATLLWLLVSVLFTGYVGRIASFDVTYGPLSAVAGVMLWFWFSAYAVLAGAELNSALELQAGRKERYRTIPADDRSA